MAISGTAMARPGDYLDIRRAGRDHGQDRGAARARRFLSCATRPCCIEAPGPELRLDVGGEPGAYRIEAHLPAAAGRPAVPWVLTNPIYVGLREAHERAARACRRPGGNRRDRRSAPAAWQAEASDGSVSTLTATTIADGTPALAWQFALAGGARGDQFAAMRFPVEREFARHDRLQLRAQSDAPRRLWAQLRASGRETASGGGERFISTLTTPQWSSCSISSGRLARSRRSARRSTASIRCCSWWTR